MNKISIITVCYNAEKTIEETIKSVVEQTYPNIEYIIVDGKSNDKTMNIIKKYKHKIAKIISEKDKGLYDAMNKGVKKASGKIIYFLNADDILVDKHVIREVAEEFEKNDFDLVYGEIDFYYPKEKRVVRISRVASISELKNGYMFPHQGSFVKKKWLQRFPFDLKYKSSSDFDFFCNFLKEKPLIKKIDKTIARMTMGGVSSGVISYNETQQVIRKHFGRITYYKVKLKHFIYKTTKNILKILKISYHKG
ncbi:MAG: glycosyltransferase family 2 protein [Candidatus ainarchaeum sp.]|nr:glycosyltransferase family 2 protein [Candidatus ainarchaeum sp.]